MIRIWSRCVITGPTIVTLCATVVTLILASGLPRIGFDVHPNTTFQSDNEASRVLARMQSVFGADDNDVIVQISGPSLLEPETLERLRTFQNEVQSLPEVVSVTSILDVNRPRSVLPMVPRYLTDRFDSERLKQDLLRHPVAANQLINRAGDLTTVLVRIRGESLPVSGITRVLDPIRESARRFERETPNEIQLAGHTAIRADVLVSIQQAMIVSCCSGAMFAFLIAWFLFRRLVTVLVVTAAPGIAAVWTFGLLAWCDVPVGGLLSALPNLVFIIGLTDAVHLVIEYQREIARGRQQRNAVYRSLLRVGPACLLTSITTMIGFGSLALSDAASVRSFGVWSAIGTGFAMLSVVMVLPTLFRWLPAEAMDGGRATRKQLSRLLLAVTSPLLRRPKTTAALAVCCCLGLLWPALAQSPDIVWTETMPDRSESVMATRLADEKMGGALVAYVMVTWPEADGLLDSRVLAATADVQRILRSAEKFEGDLSILNLLAAAPGRTMKQRYQAYRKSDGFRQNSYVNERHRTLLVSARVPNDGAAALNARVGRVQQQLDQLKRQYPGYQFTLTGTVVAASQNMNAIIWNLARSLAIAAILIFVVFAIAFRSIRLGLLSTLPNLFPLLVTAATLTLVGLPLQITSVVTFSLCLGLAVDDTIHVLIWFLRRRRRGKTAVVAARDAVDHVGPALVVTTLILLAGFAAMLTSPLPGMRLFASLSVLTLMVALVGDLLFFPALLIVGRRRRRG